MNAVQSLACVHGIWDTAIHLRTTFTPSFSSWHPEDRKYRFDDSFSEYERDKDAFLARTAEALSDLKPVVKT